MGAKELRDGIVPAASAKSVGPDVIAAMTTELFLDYIGIRVDDEKAAGLAFTINLVTPDNGERFVIEMSNSVLTVLPGHLAKSPTMSITIDRAELEKVMTGRISFADQIANGAAQLEGDASVLQKLAATLVDFDPFFEVLPGTKGESTKIDRNPFEQAVPENLPE